MKLASYNVENLFLRARAMDQSTWAEGEDPLQAHAAINKLLAKSKYTASDRKKIALLLTELGLEKSDDGGKFAILRQNRGHLVTRPKGKPLEIVAAGRSDWIGWVELKLEEVNEVATRATAHVIRDLAPDVLAVIEAESRPALVRFSEELLPLAGAKPFDHIMLIDGNDDRGIDVGIMTASGYELVSIASHVDDRDAGGPIFSRDCAAYTVRTPKKKTITVLVNHLKSKGYGIQADNDERRRRQAARVKAIYEALVASGQKLVAVVGDFNDTPDSSPLAPLLSSTDLKDISEHASFDDGGRAGTYANGAASQKIDYILLSPKLFSLAKRGGIFRMGVWGGTNGTLFPHYPEITKASEAASDHAAVWAEIDV